MTNKFEIYKCSICGNLVQVLKNGDGELVCCGENMKLMEIHHDLNELGEKHAPKIEIKDGKKFVHVKSHPMTTEHHIDFIEIYSKDKKKLYLNYFEPESIPETDITFFTEEFDAIENCNIHGVWGENPNVQ